MLRGCLRRWAMASLVVMGPGAAWANGLEALREPGAIAIMRHARAPGTGDPAAFELGDCSTQRNLDAVGRAQARAVGRALRASGVTFDRVLASEWCRARDTADLLDVGEVEPFPPLNSFFADRSTRDAQTEQVRAFLAGLPEDERVMLVTHQVNISALTGRFASSGEVIIFELGPDASVNVLAEVPPPGS